MRRAAALALLVAAFVAAPAGAQAPGPTILDFEDQDIGTGTDQTYPGRPFLLRDGDDCGEVVAAGGNFGPKFLENACDPFRILFATPQARVSLFVRVDSGPESPDATLTAFDANGQPLTSARSSNASGWTPLTVRATGDAAVIGSIQVEAPRFLIDVDDIGFSDIAQPDVAITGGPSGSVTWAMPRSRSPAIRAA